MPPPAPGDPGVVLVTRAPAPYREPVHEAVHRALPGYRVLYEHGTDPDREWTFPAGAYPRDVLDDGRRPSVGVLTAARRAGAVLERRDPALVITCGFRPAALAAFAWCRRRKRAHVAMTDGWRGSESDLTLAHRALRRYAYPRSAACIGASAASLALLRGYGVAPARLFRSPLCVDNARFRAARGAPGTYDLVFSGQFVARKNPLFFAAVAARVRERRGRCSALLLGSGPLKARTVRALGEAGVAHRDEGFLAQADLPAAYALGRLLLFPTRSDPWGVVVNEACAAGLPVITSPFAGAAHELVVDGENGFVAPLEVEAWAERAVALLDDPARHAAFAAAAARRVEAFGVEAAAGGIVEAVRFALTGAAPGRETPRAGEARCG